MFDFRSDRQSARGASEKIVAMRQAKQSVESRQRDIYESHRHRTFALAYYMTANEVEADQILTHTFVRAFSAFQEPSGPDVDAALMQEFRQRSLLCSEAPSPVSSADSCEEAAPTLEGCNVKRTDLEEAIQYLPAQERLLFLLRDVEGYSPAAIAKLLEIPEQQVNRTLFAARLRLRRVLAEAQQETRKAA